MITQRTFAVDPWCVRETALDLDVLAQSESVFALSNGHIGLRGNLDEGEPHGLPGTYLNSVYELRPLPQAEVAYGLPESGQTIINVTNGKLIRLLVDDEPFDVRYGELRSHERVLDLRSGILTRALEWVSPAGQGVRVRTQRLVSFVQRSIAAICYEVEAVDQAALIVLQSELFANEQLPAVSADPRVAAVLDSPLLPELNRATDRGAVLLHRTRASELRIGVEMHHEVDGPADTEVRSSATENIGRTLVICALDPGQRLRVVKFLAYGWSSQRSLPALHDQVEAALAAARHTGWDGLLAAQRAYLEDFWERADVEVAGDAALQQAVRFALFHVLQAGARTERRAIPSKGLTGPGYDGHTFWDTETFVLPVLTYTRPDAAADALRWRRATLPIAMERAEQLGLAGAAFPWRTIRGEECSGYWPAGTAAFHVNADIADAVVCYVSATEDRGFEADTALPLLVQTARLWRSLGHHDSQSRFRIDGVTGPDEYSAVADNNVYTNLMAQRNLRAAAAAAIAHPREAHELGVNSEEIAAWRDAAAAMIIPFDETLGVHPAAEGFTEHALWDFAATPPEHYPLLLHYPYFDLYRKQVVKQADLVLAMLLCPDAFTAEQKARNFAYYERITVRDSSLSAGVQAVLAAETGHLDLAYAYACESALMDLADLEGNTRDGMHLAALAGTWNAIVAGFGGMRTHDGAMSFAPRLPDALTRLAFRMQWRGRALRVEVGREEACYQVCEGEPITLCHHGEEITVAVDKPVTRPVPPAPKRPRLEQPAGREPLSPGARGTRPGSVGAPPRDPSQPDR